MDIQANNDARTALGVRHGERPQPVMLLDGPLHASISHASHETQPSISIIIPTSPGGNSSSTFGLSPSRDRRRRPTLSRKPQQEGFPSDRGLLETQKLLSYLLDRLDHRPALPDLLDRAAQHAAVSSAEESLKGKSKVVQLGGAVASAAKIGAHKRTDTAGSLDMDISERPGSASGQADTTVVYDLVEQTRDILVLSQRQGLDIFGSTTRAPVTLSSRPDARDRRKGSRFSSSPIRKATQIDDQQDVMDISGPDLLHRLTKLLRSILTVDCMYSTRKFRLLQPPFALQTVCLDIAAVAYHHGTLEVQLDLMDAVIASMYSMADTMRGKVCEWLEGRLGELLRKLEIEGDVKSGAVEWTDPFAWPEIPPSPGVPTFAFSVESEDPPPPTSSRAQGWMRFSPTSPNMANPWHGKVAGVLSSYSPGGTSISDAALRISAVVPKLLVAVTSMIDLNTATITTINRVYRLLSLVLSAKADAALDLLQIIGYGPPISRRVAGDLLATFFSMAAGHNVIARRPALATYQAHLQKWTTGNDQALGQDEVDSHYYVPWRPSAAVPCALCDKPCRDTVVRCTLCGELKHVGCLDLYGDEVLEYNVTIVNTTAATVETVHARFSRCIARLDELVLSTGSSNTLHSTQRWTGIPITRQTGREHEKDRGHGFYLVNLFTLTLCADCLEPLWGSTAQAYVCLNLCQRFFHPACAEKVVASNDRWCPSGYEIQCGHEAGGRDPFSISVEELRRSFRGSVYFRDLEALQQMSYDEVAAFYAYLCIQRDIFANGLEAGTLRVVGDAKEDPIGLSDLINRVQGLLTSGNLQVSPAISDYTEQTGESVNGDYELFWNLRYLQYCTAILRAVDEGVQEPPSPSLLSADDHASSPVEPVALSYEVLDMVPVRDCLRTELSLHDETAAALFLEQLRCLGLCTVAECRSITPEIVSTKGTAVLFPLPLLIDSGPTVELLVNAIEQLLDDISLTANEQGLSLLFNRGWPTVACSSYALERLGGAVMSWVMAEDSVLHYVVKHYGSQRKRPPGVRDAPGMRGTTAVQTYKEDRGRLLTRYVIPWLRALHDLDPEAYITLGYQQSKVIDDRWETIDLAQGDGAAAQAAGLALDRITSLADADAAFSSTLELLTGWLEDVGELAQEDIAFKSLPRLLRHAHHSTDSELWRLAKETSEGSVTGAERVCRWLRVLACSGVEVPWSLLINLVDLNTLATASNSGKFDLITAISVNTTTIEAQKFADLCNEVLSLLIFALDQHNQTTDEPPSVADITMLRVAMLSVLRAYGTPPEVIATSSLGVEEHKPKAGAGKRKPLALPPNSVIMALDFEAVQAACKLLNRRSFPTELALDFLWLLIVKAKNVDNADGFLHHTCSELYEALWPLYDHKVERRARARLFLKLLTINTKPLERLLLKEADTNRGVVRERLLTFALELADDTVTCDVSNWRRSAVSPLMIFFNTYLALWDARPEVLVIWETFFPTHLRAISACFEDYLAACSDEQRLRLLTQLTQLQRMKPTWPILSWNAIDQLVIEEVANIGQYETIDSEQGQAAFADAWTIRAGALALALRMIAAGVECKWPTLQRIQQHVAAACVLPWPTQSDALTEILFPAIRDILDSSVRILMHSGSALVERDKLKTTIVGSSFVSTVINFANDLGKLEFHVQRYVLEMLLVVFFKHNISPVEMDALKALQTLGLYAAACENVDHAMIAIQVLRTARKRLSKDRISRVLPQLFILVAEIVAETEVSKRRPGLHEQCCTFLNEAIAEYGRGSLFISVLRVDGAQERKRPKEALGRALQVLGNATAATGKPGPFWLDKIMEDLTDTLRMRGENMGHALRSFSQLAATLKDQLSEDNVHLFGEFLSRLTKHVGEWESPDRFDPNPTLKAAACILRLSPDMASNALLHQTSTFLSLALSRCSVKRDAVQELLPISVDVARKQQTENTVRTVLFEVCGGAMSGLPVTAETLYSLLDFVANDNSNRPAGGRHDVAVDAAAGCLAILQRAHPTIDLTRSNADITMNLLSSAAAVILRAERSSPGTLAAVLTPSLNDAAVVQLGVWVHILHASTSVKLGAQRVAFAALFPIIARATALCMYAAAEMLAIPDSGTDGPHYVSLSFQVVRLVVLAAAEEGEDESEAAKAAVGAFWRRIWPEWHRLLITAVSKDTVNTTLQAVVISVLLDAVRFLAESAPELLTEPAALIAGAMQKLEEWYAAQGQPASSKLLRALAALEGSSLPASALGARGREASKDWSKEFKESQDSSKSGSKEGSKEGSRTVSPTKASRSRASSVVAAGPRERARAGSVATADHRRSAAPLRVRGTSAAAAWVRENAVPLQRVEQGTAVKAVWNDMVATERLFAATEMGRMEPGPRRLGLSGL